ncbi:MAG: hypothetical protein ACYDBQ_02755 [Thermoplasmatota archaeon]
MLVLAAAALVLPAVQAQQVLTCCPSPGTFCQGGINGTIVACWDGTTLCTKQYVSACVAPPAHAREIDCVFALLNPRATPLLCFVP